MNNTSIDGAAAAAAYVNVNNVHAAVAVMQNDLDL